MTGGVLGQPNSAWEPHAGAWPSTQSQQFGNPSMVPQANSYVHGFTPPGVTNQQTIHSAESSPTRPNPSANNPNPQDGVNRPQPPAALTSPNVIHRIGESQLQGAGSDGYRTPDPTRILNFDTPIVLDNVSHAMAGGLPQEWARSSDPFQDDAHDARIAQQRREAQSRDSQRAADATALERVLEMLRSGLPRRGDGSDITGQSNA